MWKFGQNLLLARFGSEGVKEPTHCLLRVGDIDPDVVVYLPFSLKLEVFITHYFIIYCKLHDKEFGKSPPTSFANYS